MSGISASGPRASDGAAALQSHQDNRQTYSEKVHRYVREGALFCTAVATFSVGCTVTVLTTASVGVILPETLFTNLVFKPMIFGGIGVSLCGSVFCVFKVNDCMRNKQK